MLSLSQSLAHLLPRNTQSQTDRLTDTACNTIKHLFRLCVNCKFYTHIHIQTTWQIYIHIFEMQIPHHVIPCASIDITHHVAPYTSTICLHASVIKIRGCWNE